MQSQTHTGNYLWGMQSHTAHGKLFGGHPVILTTHWALRLSLDWHGYCTKGNLEGLDRQKLILWILLIQILEKASREHGDSVCLVFYSALSDTGWRLGLWEERQLGLVTWQLPALAAWVWPQIRFGLLIDLQPASPFTLHSVTRLSECQPPTDCPVSDIF